MSKYYIDCRDVEWPGCSFSTEGDTIEEVVERLADHVRIHQNVRSFGQDLIGETWELRL